MKVLVVEANGLSAKLIRGELVRRGIRCGRRDESGAAAFAELYTDVNIRMCSSPTSDYEVKSTAGM